jgi:hypothetical protein
MPYTSLCIWQSWPPAGALWAIHEHDALGRQLHAHSISSSKVLGSTCSCTRSNALLNLAAAAAEPGSQSKLYSPFDTSVCVVWTFLVFLATLKPHMHLHASAEQHTLVTSHTCLRKADAPPAV